MQHVKIFSYVFTDLITDGIQITDYALPLDISTFVDPACAYALLPLFL